MQRPGLLLLDGVVYAGFASHCDYGPYVGYVAGCQDDHARDVDAVVDRGRHSNGEAGIWQSGGGLVSDGSGRIILATGNGVSPAPGPGTCPPGNLAESVVRLQVNADGSLTAKDFFSPANNSKLDQNDIDFGSGGPLALPDGFGTTAHPHLLVQDGKDGRVFLLDRDNLGGTRAGRRRYGRLGRSAGRPVQRHVGPPGVLGRRRRLRLRRREPGLPARASSSASTAAACPCSRPPRPAPSTFGYTSGSPVVTSTGTTSGSAIVWVVYSDGATGANGQLRAYDAVPAERSAAPALLAPIGTARKFAVPGDRRRPGLRRHP